MRNPNRQSVFRFRRFEVQNARSAMKVSSDSVLLGAWAFNGQEALAPCRILDIGTGTGVLALMAAQRFEGADVCGVEIDESAACEAAENFRNSPWGDRLAVVYADFLEWGANVVPHRYDFIISNPPYFQGGVAAPDTARQVARHSDRLPLKALFKVSADILCPNGRLALILPAALSAEATFQAAMAALEPKRICYVADNPTKSYKRVLMEFGKCSDGGTNPIREELFLHSLDGSATARYSELVSPFYIHSI